MHILQTLSEFEQFKIGAKPVIFEFTANWCPDCRFIDPFMPEVVEKYSDFHFVKVDRDQFIDLCIELNVIGIPSFVAYENDTELGRFVSKDRKTQEEIESFITGLKSEKHSSR
ncbi:thioredoxin family protein [Solibacillus sp. MA9]|uniref:Thioredoxin family protein n=1 Tax=Solibacillus palustris TaxID=2908203 RepID=A0ABS9UF75_9BACL|nr:thioredoxin family protein [Solibacillus sp. MA9]MCH7323013.1 thioredoxin family protein [Solibacillus sp. MA9]